MLINIRSIFKLLTLQILSINSSSTLDDHATTEQKYWNCRFHECVDTIDVCDGQISCRVKLAEADYCKQALQTVESFRCHDHSCWVLIENVCDGEIDCSDGSDENVCGGCGVLKSCSNGNCIEPSRVCDGINDCVDFSDELMCPEDPWKWLEDMIKKIN